MFTFLEFFKTRRDPDSVKWKAGGFPYFVDETGEVYICLFISNNAKYGGSRPQMPKGHPDAGERPVDASARETYEETGIPLAALKMNAHLVTVEKFRGETSDYMQYVYGFPIDRPYKAQKNNEGKGLWFTAKDAERFIRKDQKKFLKKLFTKLKR